MRRNFFRGECPPSSPPSEIPSDTPRLAGDVDVLEAIGGLPASDQTRRLIAHQTRTGEAERLARMAIASGLSRTILTGPVNY